MNKRFVVSMCAQNPEVNKLVHLVIEVNASSENEAKGHMLGELDKYPGFMLNSIIAVEIKLK